VIVGVDEAGKGNGVFEINDECALTPQVWSYGLDAPVGDLEILWGIEMGGDDMEVAIKQLINF